MKSTEIIVWLFIQSFQFFSLSHTHPHTMAIQERMNTMVSTTLLLLEMTLPVARRW